MIAALVVAFGIAPSGAASRNAHTKNSASAHLSIPPCDGSSVRLSASTSQHRYGPGQPVVMIATIRNVSSVTCSIAVGAISPSLSVTNAKGLNVWRNCGANSSMSACPLYLMIKDLQPGAAYKKTATWNQHAGKSTSRVPVGTYVLTTKFNTIATQASTTFRLTTTTAPRIVTATEVNNGQRWTLHIGDRLVVHLSGPSIYNWTAAVSSNAAVLERLSGTSGKSSTTTFVARSIGNARVTSTGNPVCYPQCLTPSRLYNLNVTVIAVT